MFKPPAHCQGFLHLLLRPHEQHFLLYLHLQMVGCKSEPVFSGYRPSNWQDVCGQTQRRRRTGDWQHAWDRDGDGVKYKDQGSVLPPAPGAPLLNEILTSEELIKTTSCTTEPLCCCLASVTLASESLKVPVLRANPPSSAQLAEARLIFISRTTWLPLLHTDAMDSSDKYI